MPKKLESDGANTPDSDDVFSFGGGAGALRMSSLLGAPTQIPNSDSNSARGRAFFGDAVGALTLSNILTDSARESNFSVHGDTVGAVNLSTKLSTIGLGPVPHSTHVDGNGENVSSQDKDNITNVGTDVLNIHGNNASSLALSDSNLQHQQEDQHEQQPQQLQEHQHQEAGKKEKTFVSAATSPTRPAPEWSDADTVEDVLQFVAMGGEWSAQELEEDVRLFARYRVKTVKQLRGLSAGAWDEMDQLLPTTKDLVKQAVGWTE